MIAGLWLIASAISQSHDYFIIQVVDDQTGRGVPLVELRTTGEVSYYTDSNGIVAFYEPGLMGQTVYFKVASDGYEFPQDSFGNRGVALKVTSGGRAELKIQRQSIAERLYRITGEGIYRDSVLVGASVPLKQPVLNAQVMGQDGGLAIPYRGRIYWFWGDTSRVSYPLGNFGVSGATSAWPAKGGLDPSAGIDLSYFVDDSGFSRPMLSSENFPGPGPKWLGGLKLVLDERGRERLVADYVRVKDLGEAYERGVAIWNDESNSFERLAQFDVKDAMATACWGGHPVRVKAGDTDYYYQSYAPPFLCRMRADLDHMKAPASFAGFTPLVAGTRYNKEATSLDRSADGSLHYAWKENTPPLTPSEEQELIAAGKIKPAEALFQLRDIDTDRAIKPHAGSVQWNSFCRCWVMIVKEDEGLANHGAIWFAQGDTPLGPWVYAKRVLRHDKYNFYNPVHHAFLDQDGGRVIYFEGTYSDFFSAGATITPRYNYNQIMYRISLDDPRLALPAPVYLVHSPRSSPYYLLQDDLDAESVWDSIAGAPFFAVPPRAAHAGLVPIYASRTKRGSVLSAQPSPGSAGSSPLFYALPASPAEPLPSLGLAGKWSCQAQTFGGPDYDSFALDLRVDGQAVRSVSSSQSPSVEGTVTGGEVRLTLKHQEEIYNLAGRIQDGQLGGEWQSGNNAAEKGIWKCKRSTAAGEPEPKSVVALYEYSRPDGTYLYSIDPNLPDQGLKRSSHPLCRVWRNPLGQLLLDNAKPVLVTPPRHRRN